MAGHERLAARYFFSKKTVKHTVSIISIRMAVHAARGIVRDAFLVVLFIHFVLVVTIEARPRA
jgi:hypothetical protein